MVSFSSSCCIANVVNQWVLHLKALRKILFCLKEMEKGGICVMQWPRLSPFLEWQLSHLLRPTHLLPTPQTACQGSSCLSTHCSPGFEQERRQYWSFYLQATSVAFSFKIVFHYAFQMCCKHLRRSGIQPRPLIMSPGIFTKAFLYFCSSF